MSHTNGHLPPELPKDDSKAGKSDSSAKPKSGDDPAKLAKQSQPISGESLVSWAELLRQAPRGSDDEVNIGSLPEIRIDAVSDNDLIKHLEREAGTGSSRKLLLGGPKKPDMPPSPKPVDPACAIDALSSDSAKHNDWYKDLPEDGGSSVDLMNAAKAALNLHGEDEPSKTPVDDSDVLSTALLADDGTSAVNLGKEPRSAPMTPIIPTNMPLNPRASTAPRPRPASLGEMKPRKAKRSLSSWVGGTIGGVAGAGLVAAALWASGELHLGRLNNSVKQTPLETAAGKPTPEQAQKFLVAGEPQHALAVYGECEATPAVLAGRGQARWLDYLRQQKSKHAALAENNEAVASARKDLIASKTAEGALWLGLINESFGKFDTAREAYDNGRVQFPERARLFAAARSRLDALTNHRNKKVAKVADPQLGFALSLLLLQLPEDAGGPGDAGEAGFDFWEAVRLSRGGEFAAARQALQKARAAHEQRRNVDVRPGLNPESDPRQEIFLNSCDQLQAWWDFQERLQFAGFKLEGQTPAEVVGSLLENQKKFDLAMKALGAKLKIDRPDDVAAALDGVVAARMKAEAEVRKAQSELQTVETALKSAQNEREKAEADARKIKADLQAAEAALKTAQTDKTKAEADVRKLQDDLKTAEANLKTAQDERQKTETEVRKAQTEMKVAEAALKSVQSDRQKAVADFRKAQADLQTAQANAKTAQAERAKAEADVARIQGDLQAAETALKTAQADRLKAETELKAAQQEAAKFAADLKAVQVEAAKVADQLKAAKMTAAEATAAATKAESDLKAARKESADNAKELTIIKQSISKSDNELISAKKDLLKVNESMSALRKSASQEASRARVKYDELAKKETEARQSLQLLSTKEADVRKALAEVAAARRAADEQIQLVRSKLQQAKLVGDQATPAELARALDTLVSVNPAVKNAEIADLKALLEKSRSPRQMLDLWPVLLHGEAPRELAVLALADADAAVAVAGTADARTRAKAEAVKALALFVREDFSRARTMLEQVAKESDLMGDSAWAGRIQRAQSELIDAKATAAQVRRWLAHGDSARALELANRGLRIFPREGFSRDHARLLALRGEVQVKLNRFDEAQRDADAAAEAGLVAEGRFTSGYVAERRGQWAKAREDYRAAFDAAGDDAARIRLALARVLAGPDAGDADLEQAAKLAEQCVASGQAEGHLVKARVLYRLKKPAQAVEAALQGLKGLAPVEYSDDWLTVYRSVPLAAPRIDTPLMPDPKLAEKLFSYGLKAYYNKSFGDAEEELMNAVRNNNQDARYYYFLGLARLQQGKIEAAQDDFRQASALERQGLPDSQTLNGYFERIQGPERQLINRYRP